MAHDETRVAAADKWMARLLGNRMLMRFPVPLYRAGLGFLLGKRLVMMTYASGGEPDIRIIDFTLASPA